MKLVFATSYALSGQWAPDAPAQAGPEQGRGLPSLCSDCLEQGATGPQNMAGPPRFRARTCRVAPHESNVKVIQSTGALSKLPGRPRQGFPDVLGRACAPRGDAGAVIP